MAYLSFDEKAWDKIRPSSVKKTGVSEALRAFEKMMPKKADDLVKTDDCKALVGLLDTLVDKLNGAKARFDAKKHVEQTQKVTSWISDVGQRRKLISSHGVQLLKTYADGIDEANKAIDPFFEQAEEAKTTASELVSNLQDRAKQAVLAATKGDTEAVLKHQEYADKALSSFKQLVSEAKAIHPKVVKAADAKLPKGSLLDEDQFRKHTSTISRVNAIKYKVEDLDDIGKLFAEAYELIAQAASKNDDLQAKFVKLVAADVVTCQQLASGIGSTETNIALAVQKASEFLDEAEKPNIASEEKLRLVGESGKRLKDAIVTIKRFETQIASVQTVMRNKLLDYPDFISSGNPKFTKSMKDWQVVEKVVGDFESKSLPAFKKKAKSIGERIVELQK